MIKQENRNGSVWESNPQRALFKPATGFEVLTAVEAPATGLKTACFPALSEVAAGLNRNESRLQPSITVTGSVTGGHPEDPPISHHLCPPRQFSADIAE
jgi:hypothetical protein